MEIIIRKPKGYHESRDMFGKSRSEIERTIKKHGVSHGLNEEQIEKCARIEKRTGKFWPSVAEIEREK